MFDSRGWKLLMEPYLEGTSSAESVGGKTLFGIIGLVPWKDLKCCLLLYIIVELALDIDSLGFVY